jgi:hypothetical protein
MPFLRRHGNAPRDTDAERHAPTTTADEPNNEANACQPTETVEAPSVPTELSGDRPSSFISYQPRNSRSRPGSPPVQEQSHKHRRFSTLRFRNASDPQLSLRLKQAEETTPPVPTPRMCSSHIDRRVVGVCPLPTDANIWDLP